MNLPSRSASASPSSGFREKKDLLIIAALVGVSALIRLFPYLNLPPAASYASLHPTLHWYYEALQFHLGDYLFIQSFKPPLVHLITAGLLHLAGGPAAFVESRAPLQLVLLLDLAALALLYSSLRLSGVRPAISAMATAAVSLFFTAFTFWKFGGHYDHLNLFFITLFIHGLALYLNRQTRPALIYLAITSALAAALLPVFGYVGVATLFALGATLAFRAWPRETLKKALTIGLTRFVLAALGIVILFTGIKIKNSRLGIGAVISNAAGQNLMLVAFGAMGIKTPPIDELVEKSDLPAWYKWCYTHPDPVIFEGISYADMLRKSYGMCLPTTLHDSGSWPYNFDPLIARLEETGETELARLVKMDKEIATERPYLFAGVSPEMSPRWMGLYGNVSVQLAKKALLTYPRKFVNVYYGNYHALRFAGPYFPAAHFNNQANLGDGLLRLAQVMGQVFNGAVSFLHRFIFLSAALMLFWTVKNRQLDWLRRWWDPFGFFLVPYILLIVFYTTLSWGENDRYFLQLVPFIALLVSLSAEILIEILSGLYARWKGQK